MQKDAAQYVKKCEKCQRFAPSIHQPTSSLNPISSPWSIAQWGLDLVGPLPRAPGNRQWLIVASDYFTKWVETESLTHITDTDSKKFVWRNIITRFGIPRVLVSDNGTQFDSGPFKAFVSSTESETTSICPLILRETVKRNPPIRSCWTESRSIRNRQKRDELRNHLAFYGCTGPPHEVPPAKPHSH